MGIDLKAVQALDLWRGAIVESVRRDAPDLSARQMALLLTVYLTPPAHTVRGLAITLNISKPAVTRALDRLGLEFFESRDERKIHGHAAIGATLEKQHRLALPRC